MKVERYNFQLFLVSIFPFFNIVYVFFYFTQEKKFANCNKISVIHCFFNI